MLTELQERLLQLLKWTHAFCVDNRINYYVIGGTMLGAVRHQGFIPWDDDVDIIMPRPDYERFCNLLASPKDSYVVETPYSGKRDYIYGYAKLYDTNTLLVENLKHPLSRGVFLDVFALDGLGNSLKESQNNYKKIDRLYMLLTARTCAVNERRKWYKNFAIVAANIIPDTLMDDNILAQKLDSLCASFGYSNNEYVANCISTYRKKEIIEKRIFGNPTEYSFEDTTVFGVEHYDEYLTNLFGDWRKLPPPEKRVSVHDYLMIDFNESYLSMEG